MHKHIKCVHALRNVIGSLKLDLNAIFIRLIDPNQTIKGRYEWL